MEPSWEVSWLSWGSIRRPGVPKALSIVYYRYISALGLLSGDILVYFDPFWAQKSLKLIPKVVTFLFF